MIRSVSADVHKRASASGSVQLSRQHIFILYIETDGQGMLHHWSP